MVASVVFYILASQTLGFLVCSTLILTALFAVSRVPVGKSILIAVIASLVIHLAFYKMLRVPLPWGLMKNYTW